MNGCARCHSLRDALDAGDDDRVLELLEDLYDETETGALGLPTRSGGPEHLGEAEGPPRTNVEAA